MRICSIGIFAGLGLLIGCSRETPEQQKENLRLGVVNHFVQKNAEASLRRIRAEPLLDRGSENEHFLVGRLLNVYVFDPNGFFGPFISCRARECGLKQPLVVVDPARGARCPKCATVLVPAGQSISQVKESHRDWELQPAFDFKEGTPLKAEVRYVRQQWVYDPLASIRVPSDIFATIELSTKEVRAPRIEVNREQTQGTPGLYRVDSVYEGKGVFEYRRGKAVCVEGPTETPYRLWEPDLHVMNSPRR